MSSVPYHGPRGTYASNPRKWGSTQRAPARKFPSISQLLTQRGASTVGLRSSDPIQIPPTAHGTTCSSRELAEKGTKNSGQRKGDALGTALRQSSRGLHGATIRPNTPALKIPIFTQIRAQRAAAAQGGKHVHPFIDGTRDGLPSHASDGGQRRVADGKAFFLGVGTRGKTPAPCPKPREQRKRQRCAMKPGVSRGGGVISPAASYLLSYRDRERAGTGGQHHGPALPAHRSASRRARAAASFLVAFLQVLGEKTNGNKSSREEGTAPPLIHPSFFGRWASRTSASACG